MPRRSLQLQDELQDLVLDGHVERRRRLVGEQQLRLARQRDRDHHALAHAAGELVRIVVEPARGRRNADEVEELDGPPRPLARPRAGYAPSGSRRSARRTDSTGFSAVIGSWKIIAISRPRTARSCGSGMPIRSRPCQSTEPPIRAGEAARGRRWSEASCSCPNRTRRPGQAPRPDCRSRSMPSTAIDPCRAASRTATTSPRIDSAGSRHRREPRSPLRPHQLGQPSPSRLKPRPVTTIAMPGKIEIHQAVDMKFLPSAMSTPHSAAGGCAPRPR